MNARTLLLSSLPWLTSFAAAQVPMAIPYGRTLDLLVLDTTTNDAVWRFADLNQDGDYLDAGEITSYYSDTVGAIAWTSPSAIVCAQDGTVYVTEISNDQIYALRDQNGDGDANDPGEIRVFFDGTNAGGFGFPFGYGITVDGLGRVFVTVNNASTPAGPDRILLLQDLNADGDALDAGEAVDYYTFPGTTGSLATSIPVKVVVGPDGNVYYTEVGTGFTKGVWRLVDANNNGNCNDPGEASLFWTPPFSTSPQYWGLAVDWLGNFTVTDHATGNEKVWRGRDANADGTIDASETTLFYQTTGSSWWDVVLRDDGTVLLFDSDTPDKITACKDLNADGDALDAGEAVQAYQSGLGSVALAVRGGAFLRAPLFDSVAAVNLGGTAFFNLHANRPGDLCVSIFSLGFGPAIPLAPWGVIEIDLNSAIVYGVGIADATATFAHTLAIPTTPSIVGNYAFQGWCGDLNRLFFSNAVAFVIQ